MSERGFEQARRQEILGVVIMLADNIRKIVRASLGIIAVAVVQPQVLPYLKWIALGILVFTAAFTILQFRKFIFYVADGELILEKGVFVKDRLAIPFERIQTVNIQQNLVQQIVQLSGVKIDTAGSGKEELEIKALSKSDAIALKDLLQSEREKSLPNEETSEQSSENLSTSEQKAPKERKKLVSLSIKQLLVVGLTENHIRSGLIAFALLWGYASQYAEFIGEELESRSVELGKEMVQAGWYALLFFIITFLVVSTLTSLVRVVLQFFNLEAVLEGQKLWVKAGLLKRVENTIPLTKIQFIEWHDNPLRRALGFQSLKVFQSKSEDRAKKSVEIPACFPEQEAVVCEELYPGLDQDPNLLVVKSNRHYARVLIAFFSLPILIISGLLFLKMTYLGIAVFLILSALNIYLSSRFVSAISLKLGAQYLTYERGFLFRKRTILPLYKGQTLRLKQTPFTKRRKLAHLTFSTASGNRSIRYLPIDEAMKVYNYLLAQVEQSSKSWM